MSKNPFDKKPETKPAPAANTFLGDAPAGGGWGVDDVEEFRPLLKTEGSYKVKIEAVRLAPPAGEMGKCVYLDFVILEVLEGGDGMVGKVGGECSHRITGFEKQKSSNFAKRETRSFLNAAFAPELAEAPDTSREALLAACGSEGLANGREIFIKIETVGKGEYTKAAAEFAAV